MPRLVTMVAEIIEENCTGCDLCVKVCPTAALRLEPKKPGEPGRGKRIAKLEADDCYNIQNCLEMCPEDAIVMRELDEPFEIGINVADADPKAVADLVKTTGYPAQLGVCVCTGTTIEEIAAAIVLGADTPEKITVATGARTGCTEICVQPIMQLLKAAGHADTPKTFSDGYQTYEVCGTLWEHVDEEGNLPEELRKEFPPYYNTHKELSDMTRYRKQLMESKDSLQQQKDRQQ